MLTNFSAPFAHGARIWLSKCRACTMSPPSFVVARALLQFRGQDTLIHPRLVRWTNFHSFLKSSRTSAAWDLARWLLNSCDGRFVVCRKREKKRENSRWWVCKYMKRKLEFENRIWECGWSLFSLEMFSPILTLCRGSFSSSSRFDRMFDLVPEVDLKRSNYRSFFFFPSPTNHVDTSHIPQHDGRASLVIGPRRSRVNNHHDHSRQAARRRRRFWPTCMSCCV